MQIQKTIFFALIAVSLVASRLDATTLSTEPRERLIYTIKNRHADLKDRRAALKQLVAQETLGEDIQKMFLEMLEEENKPGPFHHDLVQAITQSKTPYIIELLKTRLQNQSTVALQKKELALDLLWQIAPSEVLNWARDTASNRLASQPLRITALQYMVQDPNHPDHQKLASEILHDRTQAVSVRQAALAVIEATGDSKIYHDAYLTLLQNPSEDMVLRNFAILKAQLTMLPDLQNQMIAILKNPKETVEFRTIVLQALTAGFTTPSTSLIHELKQLSYDNSNHEFGRVLSQTIAALEEKLKAS